MERIDNLIKSKFKDVKFNTPLKNFSSFRIGGNAEYFFEASAPAELARILSFAKKHRLRWFILGGGTNVLFGDVGYKGLVIHMAGTDIKRRGAVLRAEAGANLQKVALESVRAGLSGLENLNGIPGTIGGAVCGNAGTQEGEIGDCVLSAKVFDAAGGHVKTLKKRDLKFSYRNSLLKKNRGLILISVVLKLKKAESLGALRSAIKKASERRNLTQPKGLSCGCVFMNPTRKVKGRLMSAGELIDKAGLKGTQIGGARISEKHGNFFINKGGATSKDMLKLIETAKKKVCEKFGVKLKEEIEIA